MNLAFDHRPINFFHGPLTKLFRKSGSSLAGASEEEYSRHHSIQAMDDPQKHIAGLAIFFLEIGLHDPIESLLFSGEMSAQTAGRLRNRQAMVIFVQDFRQL